MLTFVEFGWKTPTPKVFVISVLFFYLLEIILNYKQG